MLNQGKNLALAQVEEQMIAMILQQHQL